MIKKSDVTLENLIAREITFLRSDCQLFGLEFDNHSNPKVLRIYVDKIENNKNGINLDDCVQISYHLRTCLKVMPDFNFSNYTLEVSSPGVERKLFNLLQFENSLGKIIKLHLLKSLDGRSNFIGTLSSVDHFLNKVFLKIDEQEVCFDFDNIAKANLIYRKL